MPLGLRSRLTAPLQALEIDLRYEYDSRGFFDQPGAREAIRACADFFEEVITDDLAGIDAGSTGRPENSWAARPLHPSTGERLNIENLLVPPNTKIIYLGSMDHEGTAAGRATTGYRRSGFQPFFDLVKGSGQLRQSSRLRRADADAPASRTDTESLRTLTDLELAALRDLGWQVELPVRADSELNLDTGSIRYEISTTSNFTYQIQRSDSLQAIANSGAPLAGNGSILELATEPLDRDRIFLRLAVKIKTTSIFSACRMATWRTI